jgi:hypothetical protein
VYQALYGPQGSVIFDHPADYERQAAKVRSAPEGAQIVQFGRSTVSRDHRRSPIAVPLKAIRVEVSAVGQFREGDSRWACAAR